MITNSSKSLVLLSLLFSAVVLLLPSCINDTGKGSEEQIQHSRIRLPVATTITTDVLKETVIPGVVSALPDHSVKVSPAISGKLVEVLAIPGQTVRRGEVIARLDDRHILEQLEQCNAAAQTTQANIVQAQNNLTFAQDNWNRQQKLFIAEVSAKKEVVAAEYQLHIAESQLAAAQSQLKSAQANCKQIVTELSFTKVRSPIDGTVANRYLNVGDTTDLNIPIIQVVGLDTVIINALLPADSPEKVQVGQRALVKSVSRHDITFDGTVISVSPVVDTQTNTIRVQLKCTNHYGEFREGQAVTVAINSKVYVSAILIPKSSVVPDPNHPDRQMVYVVSKGRAHRVPIKIGATQGNQVAIISGLHPGTTIITEGAYGLPDDSEIEPEVRR